ncbi:sulfurtransferase [Nitriliruptoraceae bacterium ZYF776]|nr:sulfurtransferase [Profundirhabdus halotolerans]
MSSLPRPTVDAAWLADHLDDPSLRLFDATAHLHIPDDGGEVVLRDGRETFEREHLPGARFVDLGRELSDPDAPAPFTVPSPEHAATALGHLGVGDGAYVVVYDQHQTMWASRLWWQLRLEGHEEVAVLDGGLPAWKAAGLPTTSGPSEPYPATTFTSRRRPELVATKDDVLARLDDDRAVLINALDPATFRGEVPTYARPGHIPGSANVFFADLVDPETGRLRPADELHERLAGSGALRDDVAVTTYCGGGIAATLDALALAVAGRDDVAVYDGSLNEWTADPALPLRTG